MTPAPHLIERLRGDFIRLAGEPERLGIAVSGGPDSLALLLLAAAAFPGRVEAATVDHGLRPESGDEAAFVASICEQLGVPHEILPVRVPGGRDGVQGEARRVRYAALATWAKRRSLPFLCTAHHADDQAETILMRLQRGSGLGGLSGIRAVRRDGGLTIVRPLLGWTRAELSEVVAESGMTAVDDPSNRDTRFDRVTMREFLQANPEFQSKRLSRSAAALAEAEGALCWMAETLFAERCSMADGAWQIDVEGLPRELRRRLLSRTIGDIRRRFDQPWSGSEDVEGLLSTLEAGGTATLAEVMASASGSRWSLRPAPPRRHG